MPFIASVSDSVHVVSRSYAMGKPAVLFLCFANKLVVVFSFSFFILEMWTQY